MYSCGFVTDCQRGRLLRTYFYVIDISFDKTHFTCEDVKKISKLNASSFNGLALFERPEKKRTQD